MKNIAVAIRDAIEAHGMMIRDVHYEHKDNRTLPRSPATSQVVISTNDGGADVIKAQRRFSGRCPVSDDVVTARLRSVKNLGHVEDHLLWIYEVYHEKEARSPT